MLFKLFQTVFFILAHRTKFPQSVMIFDKIMSAASCKSAMLGRASCVEYIPSRQHIQHNIAGYHMIAYRVWSLPFWSVTVETDDGQFLHALLDSSSLVPDLGAPVSLVGRRNWPWQKISEVDEILRPKAVKLLS